MLTCFVLLGIVPIGGDPTVTGWKTVQKSPPGLGQAALLGEWAFTMACACAHAERLLLGPGRASYHDQHRPAQFPGSRSGDRPKARYMLWCQRLEISICIAVLVCYFLAGRSKLPSRCIAYGMWQVILDHADLRSAAA